MTSHGPGGEWPPPSEPPVALPPPTHPPRPLTAGPPPPGPVGPAFGAPPPFQPAPVGGGRVRPWWGMGDALMILPIMVGVLAIGLALIGVLAGIEGVQLSELADDELLPGSMIVLPTLVQQAAWVAWPFVVSRWKGLGPAADWGWAFKPIDLGIGLGTAMIAMFVAGVVGLGVGALVGLEDEAAAENTALVSDLKDSPWLWGLLFIVIIGAPVSEELLFRGLILRSVAKRWGNVAGVIVSLLAFVPMHLADGGLFTGGGGVTDGQIVLWATIGSLGLVLAIAAVSTGRLAASIIAHMIINAIGVAGALALWG